MIHRRKLTSVLLAPVLTLALTPAAPASAPPRPAADEGWLSSVVASVGKVLEVVQVWNAAIDNMTDQARRRQFHSRMSRLYSSFRDLETRKQNLIRSLLVPRPVLPSIQDNIQDLEQTVKRIGDDISRVSLELNLRNSIDGGDVERELMKDLSQKSEYLEEVRRKLGETNGSLPEPERQKIKERGEKALEAIRKAREAIAGTLKRLESN